MQGSEDDMSDAADIDNLPFYEYASIMAQRGAAKHGNLDTPKLTFEQLVASDMTFAEIEAEYGEETAINAGIARDPDTWEIGNEDFERMRPATEIIPELVKTLERKNKGETLPPLPQATVHIDLDISAYFRAGGLDDWQERLNDTLRKAVIAQQDDGSAD